MYTDMEKFKAADTEARRRRALAALMQEPIKSGNMDAAAVLEEIANDYLERCTDE